MPQPHRIVPDSSHMDLLCPVRDYGTSNRARHPPYRSDRHKPELAPYWTDHLEESFLQRSHPRMWALPRTHLCCTSAHLVPTDRAHHSGLPLPYSTVHSAGAHL